MIRACAICHTTSEAAAHRTCPACGEASWVGAQEATPKTLFEAVLEEISKAGSSAELYAIGPRFEALGFRPTPEEDKQLVDAAVERLKSFPPDDPPPAPEAATETTPDAPFVDDPGDGLERVPVEMTPTPDGGAEGELVEPPPITTPSEVEATPPPAPEAGTDTETHEP